MYRLTLRLHGAEVKVVLLESGREYIFGRAKTCDIRLDSLPGISRDHFKIFENDGKWTLQVLSKFGTVNHAGQPVQTLALDIGAVFQLADYQFRFSEAVVEEAAVENPEPEALPIASGQSEVVSQSLPAPMAPSLTSVPSSPFEGNEEATRIAEAMPGVPYVRVVSPDGREETLKLEGQKWIAGRDQTCEIMLNDRKSSRRQVELTSSPQGYFARDLGSSNGTLLNGKIMAADELKPIRSGDVMQIGQLQMHFEVRDPNFEKKMMVIPQDVMAPPQTESPEAPYEIINYPVITGPGGAIRVDGVLPPNMTPFDPYNGQLALQQQAEASRGKRRFYLFLAAIGIPLVAYLANMKDPESKAPAKVQTQDAFSKLTPQKQQQVKETMILAKNLFMQGKLALAADQLRKLHEILPSGYENSLAIAEQCRAQAEQDELKREFDEEQKRLAADRVIIEKNIRDCEGLANTTRSEDEMRTCLAPTIERDPSNGAIANYLGRIERRNEELMRKGIAAHNYTDQVAKGRALFNKATALEKENSIFDAIEAYKKHIASAYPDPARLKNQSRARLAAITGKMGSEVDQAMQAAETAYAAQNYRAAIDQIKRAKSYDPNNKRAAEMNVKIRTELNLKLRAYYEDAIIYEGLGQLDLAKGQWKKILETDHPDGDYYKRARSKMRTYGGM